MSTEGCPHGEPHPAACMDCVEGPPADPAPVAEQVLKAHPWVKARFDDGRCARRYQHRIYRGDRIGYVEGLGWCCDECAEPVEFDAEARRVWAAERVRREPQSNEEKRADG